MKARVVKAGKRYYGEVWLKKGWYTVTDLCRTRLGARLEIYKWREENLPKEFEI